MKKLLLPILAFFSIYTNLFATTHIVTVSNFQFFPSSLNVTVGDTITWNWVSGFHTTTSLSVPAGAASWDNPMTSSNKTFSYRVTTVGSYQYDCTIHPNSMVADFTASKALPINISLFKINTSAENKPIINWATSSELNSDYFIVKKSLDGSHFEDLKKIPAAVNSISTKNYSFEDKSLDVSTKFAYYYIATFDKAGSEQASAIKLFNNPKAASKILPKFTNPVSKEGHCMLTFNSIITGKMNVSVLNLNGKKVFDTQMNAQVGVNNGHMHLSELAAGTYVVKFSLNGNTESCKLIKE